MLKQRVHLIQTFTTSCQIHQKLKYSSRRMFSNKDQRPSDDAPFKKNIESKNYFESEYPKLKSYGSHFLIVVGALASGAAIYEAYRKYQEPLVRKPFKNFKDPDYQLPLPKKEMLLEDIINSGRLNSFLKKDIPLLFEKQSGLYVIVGESGIGKTEAFKSFVNEWKKRGTPGNFVSCQPNTTITTFLEKCFETSNEAEIDEEVQRWRRLEEAPLLVVDDIHKIYKDGKFESGILDFLKNFSDLGGKVFLLSSVSDVSYKIPHYSGYASRAYIFEIRPRDKPTMERYIREKINPLLGIRWSNEEIALFVDYFDGNIAMTKKLTQIATGQQDAQFQKIIKDVKSSVLATVKNHLKSDPETHKFLKQLVEDKGDKLSDWLSLESEYLADENDRRLLDFVKKDLFMNKRPFLFKFKNGLVREMLIEYFASDKESR